MGSAHSASHPSVNFFNDPRVRPGILGWILSTDHKRIGLLYMFVMFSFFLIAASIGFIMRLKLLYPGDWLISANMYNALFTLHGVIMVFVFVVPGPSAIFGNFFLPIMIGAADVSFPKLNLASWYMFMLGTVLAVLSLFTGRGFADTGWTFYVPYSIQTGTNVSLGVLAAFFLGFSSILTGLNFITTVHRLRAPGMDWFRLPLFVWGIYATAWIQVLATPVVGITLLLVFLERYLGIGVFDPAKGGDPVLYQHLFWIYSHPAVYVMILPALGIISEIIPTSAHRTIFGYGPIAISSMAIAIVGYLVWGHHMFTSGQGFTASVVFSFLTFLVGIPTGIKIFNWIATLYKGSIELSPPFLFALAFIFLFSIGGLTGLVNGALAVDLHIHDTYFIVGHFHYVMFGGTGIAIFAGLHYWFPKMFGRMYHKGVAIFSWALIFIGFNMVYFPMFILGYQGMPRRYYTYLPEFHFWNVVSTVGSWILVPSLFIMFANLLYALRKGKPAEQNPWGGTTLEWTVPSPPPTENFKVLPVVTGGPYDHGDMKAHG